MVYLTRKLQYSLNATQYIGDIKHGGVLYNNPYTWDGEERGDGAHGGPLQLVLLLVFLLHAGRLHLGHGMGDGGVSVVSLPRLRCHN